MKRLTPPKVSECVFFNTMKVYRLKYQCTGIKYCDYLLNTIKDIQHTEVTEELWNQIQNYRRGIDLSELNPVRRNANSFGSLLEHVYNTFLISSDSICLSKQDFRRKKHAIIRQVNASQFFREAVNQ